METINTILFWVCLWILSWNAYILLFNRGVPNIRTAPAIRRKIIEILKADALARQAQPYTIVDLGSGNGLFTRQIARALPEAKVIGIEISNLAYKWSSAFQRLCGLKNLSYIKQDFLTYDVSGASAAILFLTIYDMGRVGTKLGAELKPGTLVTSNKFRLGDGWEPLDVIQVKTLYPHQKTLHVYRKQ